MIRGKYKQSAPVSEDLLNKSFVKYQFQHIKKGQKIYEIYCPDIYTEQWNYVKLVQAYPDRDDLTGRHWSG